MRVFFLFILCVYEARSIAPQNSSFPLLIDGNYIGGYYEANPEKYSLYKTSIRNNEIEVKTTEELVIALKQAKSGSTIFLSGDKKFDLTGYNNLTIGDRVSLVSDRGLNRSKGALIITNELGTAPLFVTKGNGIIISGIRFQGPDGNIVNPKIDIAKKQLKKGDPKLKLSDARFKTYGVPNSSGIKIDGSKNVVIENCEIYQWSHAGVHILNNSDASIHHCYIHHNQRAGLGYGIVLDGAYALIKANLFDYNRHAIAGTGRLNTAYTAEFNIALSNSTNQGHVFDMHGGVDRKDGSNIAGDYVRISNNVFYYKESPVIRIRGISREMSYITSNIFISTSKKGRMNDSKTIQQTGGKRGNLRIDKNNYQ